MFTDNIVYLNSSVLPTDIPITDCGWGINRGVDGNTVIVEWKESSKTVNVYTTYTLRGFDANGNLVPANDVTTTAMDAEVTETLFNNELSRIETKFGYAASQRGDLSTLTTTAKTSLVDAINEIKTLSNGGGGGGTDSGAFETSLASSTGDTLVGTSAYTSGAITVAAGTVDSALTAIVGLVETNATGIVGVQGNLDAAVSTLNSTISADMTTVQGLITTEQNRAIAEETIIATAAAAAQTTANTVGTHLDAVVASINSNMAIYDGIASTVHTFVHNLNSAYLTVTVWTLEDTGWSNSIVATTIVDANTLQVELTSAYAVRMIVERLANVSY